MLPLTLYEFLLLRDLKILNRLNPPAPEEALTVDDDSTVTDELELVLTLTFTSTTESESGSAEGSSGCGFDCCG